MCDSHDIAAFAGKGDRGGMRVRGDYQLTRLKALRSAAVAASAAAAGAALQPHGRGPRSNQKKPGLRSPNKQLCVACSHGVHTGGSIKLRDAQMLTANPAFEWQRTAAGQRVRVKKLWLVPPA
eukprot:353313-Chlamydomonas_euryale.AAC.7